MVPRRCRSYLSRRAAWFPNRPDSALPRNLGERKDAIKRFNAVILGAVYEKVLPFLPNFPYSPKDMVFIGKSFDHLVLDGLTEGQTRKIVFLEVKSGSSRLNPNKKIIATIVAQKKAIEWKECRS